MFISLLIAGVMAGAGGSSAAAPRLPFLDWGACPFECCAYRAWTTNAPTRVLKRRHPDSPVAFELTPGETVQGLTGVVVTTQLGEAKVFRAGVIGKSKLKIVPGDVVPILRYEGEGYWKFWLRGHVDADQLPDVDDTADDSQLGLRVVTRPTTIWWVRVKNGRGQTGWTTETDHFDHMDACE